MSKYLTQFEFERIEAETALKRKELLSPRLESKLQDDAESKRLIEKTNRLQFV